MTESRPQFRHRRHPWTLTVVKGNAARPRRRLWVRIVGGPFATSARVLDSTDLHRDWRPA